MALSAAEMQEAVIKNLPEKTGKPLEDWIAIAKSFKLLKNNDIQQKLKSEFGLGHVQAQTIVWRMNGDKPYIETQGYEENIFKSTETFALYAKLKKSILSIGSDISIKPCKTYIPFYRKNQFAILTEKKGEVILGLNLNEKDYPELQNAEKIGGSERINKKLLIENDDFTLIRKYVLAAFTSN